MRKKVNCGFNSTTYNSARATTVGTLSISFWLSKSSATNNYAIDTSWTVFNVIKSIMKGQSTQNRC